MHRPMHCEFKMMSVDTEEDVKRMIKQTMINDDGGKDDYDEDNVDE